MRLIDADELLEHAYRDRLDTRERIADMIENAPTVNTINVKVPITSLDNEKLFDSGYDAGRRVGREILRGTIRMMNREIFQVISQPKYYIDDVTEIFKRYEKECDE